MTTMNITLNQVDEQMKRLQEIKMFLERASFPKFEAPEQKSEMNLIIHEYWNNK